MPAAPREIEPTAFTLIAAYANRLRSRLRRSHRRQGCRRVYGRSFDPRIAGLSLSLDVSTFIKAAI